MKKDFWDNKWKEQQTGWDIGYVSTPIKSAIDQLEDKDLKILIPGCGNSYEAEYLNEKGFKNVYVLDISPLAVASFKKRCPNFPEEHILCNDFFKLDEKFDLIIEQTFYCAITPDLRDDYCKQMNRILNKESGKLIGLLFDFPLESGPPYGGDLEEYQDRFSKHFNSVKIENCQNSIPSRQGREFWIEMSVPN